MITEKLLKQYRKYNGDLDAWSRANSIAHYDDWRMIESLVQNLWLIENNRAGETLKQETDRLINQHVENEEAAWLLYSIASEKYVKSK